jgi:hypothetical protein
VHHSLARWVVHPIVVARGENRQQMAKYFWKNWQRSVCTQLSVARSGQIGAQREAAFWF